MRPTNKIPPKTPRIIAKIFVVLTYWYEIETFIFPASYLATVTDIGVPEEDAAIWVPSVPPSSANLP